MDIGLQIDPEVRNRFAGLSGARQLMFVQCEVDPERLALLKSKRPAHLAHVQEHAVQIAFAGIVEEPGAPYQQICYFLHAASAREARSFVENDPYHCCYSDINVLPFTQKLPREVNEDEAR